ncbi:MAG: class I SAM-dependent methyltransferase [Alphaproteobacteria bacterium]|nr:class I SAM-dependent methyltransferase [Alphaproteobacteria bacterium]
MAPNVAGMAHEFLFADHHAHLAFEQGCHRLVIIMLLPRIGDPLHLPPLKHQKIGRDHQHFEVEPVRLLDALNRLDLDPFDVAIGPKQGVHRFQSAFGRYGHGGPQEYRVDANRSPFGRPGGRPILTVTAYAKLNACCQEAVMSNLPHIDAVVEPTHDEHARQRFVSVLRKRVLLDYAKDMKTVYEHVVEPRFTRKNRRKPKSGNEVRKVMLDEPIFQEWSALRHNAQLMTWWSVQPSIERKLPYLIQIAKDAAQANPAGGSLQLNSEVEIPRTVSELDVHLMPGCFHTEHCPDDVAQGALYQHGTRVFSGGLRHRSTGGWAATAANALKILYPKFAPKSYLDLGCTVGREMFSFMDIYPGMETHGIDVGAPCLRYAHAVAEADGRKVHFSQQNAEHLDFPDGSFDVVTSSFFFHEISLASSRKILKEAYRVLKPGGLMINQELPPVDLVSGPYEDFVVDWDAYYNNEPYYWQFRHQDLRQRFVEASFKAKNYIQFRVPNYGTWPNEVFKACVLGHKTPPEVSNGQAWFSFGAWK